MARRDHAAELRRYLAEDQGVDIRATLTTLPADIDAKLAAKVVLGLIEDDQSYWFARMCHKLPAPVIREVLSRNVDVTPHVFLRLAVPLEGSTAKLERAWQRALAALLDLNLTYGWGSKQRRAKLKALAKDPEILAAIQGTAANRSDVPLDMLAVLVADGTDASIDALVPHVDPALVDKDVRLDRLTRLRARREEAAHHRDARRDRPHDRRSKHAVAGARTRTGAGRRSGGRAVVLGDDLVARAAGNGAAHPGSCRGR